MSYVHVIVSMKKSPSKAKEKTKHYMQLDCTKDEALEDILVPYGGGKREPQKIPPFRIVEFFGGVVRGMTTRQRLPHLSEALWRDAETPGNSATPVPGPQ